MEHLNVDFKQTVVEQPVEYFQMEIIDPLTSICDRLHISGAGFGPEQRAAFGGGRIFRAERRLPESGAVRAGRRQDGPGPGRCS